MKQLLLLIVMFLVATTFSFSQENGGNAEDCTLPEITEVTGGGTYCPGEEVTLTLTGNKGEATDWVWYTGECGGDMVEDDDDDDTNINVTVEETTTYYIRGVGGCVDDVSMEDYPCFEVTVVLDDEPPVVECPEDREVEAEDGICEAVISFDDPTGTDNCSDDVTVERIDDGPVSGTSFPVGVTTVSYSVRDALENETICSFNITVLDTQVPEITCMEDLEVDNDPGECGAVVTFTAPDYGDNCPGAVLEQTEGLASGSFFPVGTTVITYTVTDASGNTNSCSFNIIVNDVEPPVITLNDKKQSEWPPNHKPFELNIDDYIVSVTDNCGVSEEDVIVDKMSSDEPGNGNGDGNTSDDMVVSDDCRTVRLLAERQGGGNGRVYTVYLAVADIHGNIGTAEIKAEVAHDQGKKKAVIDDGPVYVVNGCDIETDQTNMDENQEMTDNDNSTNEMDAVYLETYPNPFAHSFEIWFRPRSNDRVTVDLYSFNGAKIKEIYRGDVHTGRDYSWTYDDGNLRDELYLIVISGRESYAFKRIVRK